MQKLNDLFELATEMADEWRPSMQVNTKDILAIAEAFRALEHSLKDANACVEAAKQEIADLEQRAEAAEQMQMQQAAEVGKANAMIDALRQERDILQRIAGERGNKLEAAEAKLVEVLKMVIDNGEKSIGKPPTPPKKPLSRQE